MAGRFVLLVVAFVCMCNYILAQNIGVFYSLTETCDHDYGFVLSTIPQVRSVVACAGKCSETSGCKSAMFYTNSSVCSLNTDTADIGTLPPGCDVVYMSIEGQRPTHDISINNLGLCNLTSECIINGSVCVNNKCVCETGLSFSPEVGVCTTNRSDCKTSDWCFPATPLTEPWTNDANHLRIEMRCLMPLPNDVIPAGKLRTAILTDRPTVIQSFNYFNSTHITDREIIFINRWNATSPYMYGFHVVYYGHVLQWIGHTPKVDVSVPKAQCRLIFL